VTLDIPFCLSVITESQHKLRSITNSVCGLIPNKKSANSVCVDKIKRLSDLNHEEQATKMPDVRCVAEQFQILTALRFDFYER
jgi:hypothetical protein